MPNTLGRVQDLLIHMAHLEKPNISLLVVPGLDWRTEQLSVLRNLQNEGYTLAGTDGNIQQGRLLVSITNYILP